jgi:DNA polymerase-1
VRRDERLAVNHPVQGTAAEIVKIAMIRLQRTLRAGGYRARLTLQVHDELVLDVPEAELELVKRKLPELMAGVATLKVPLVAETGVGSNWEEAH